MSKKQNAKYYKRLLAVALRGEGKSNAGAAAITKYHAKRVSQLVSLYCNKGIGALLYDGRKGGNNRSMSKEEADNFLIDYALPSNLCHARLSEALLAAIGFYLYFKTGLVSKQ